jgi:hypothetical protein
LWCDRMLAMRAVFSMRERSTAAPLLAVVLTAAGVTAAAPAPAVIEVVAPAAAAAHVTGRGSFMPFP